MKFGDFDISELLSRIAVNYPSSGCVRTITIQKPKTVPEEFKNIQKCTDICNKQKVSFKCMLRDTSDRDLCLVVYSDPIIIDDEEYILYLGAHRDFAALLAQYYKDYRKQKTLGFYELLEYCKFDIPKILDYLVKNVDRFDENYKTEILGYLNEE